MRKFLEKITNAIMPLVGMLIFVTLLIVAIIFLSYVFIAIAIAGFVLFTVGYIRARYRLHKYPQQHNDKRKPRTIDHDSSD